MLDPFTGTGTFITRLLQSDLIPSKDLARKFRSEIHANEIVLLAYYVASANIEKTYRQVRSSEGRKAPYVPFEGICLTDTFVLQDEDDLVAQMMPENSDRRTVQRELDIRVIVSNPPWSAGQKDAMDNAANLKYPVLDERIKRTYADSSKAALRRALSDSYVRALRWASDRIGERGVIAFVTNAGWLDNLSADGVRKCVSEEFTDVYVFRLRGDATKSGEAWRREGGKIFEQGSRAAVALCVFVKGNRQSEQASIRIRTVADYLTTHSASLAAANLQRP